MQPLYPEIKPYARHTLAVDDTHSLYIDESGSPDGIPVLFVHGGPGGGCGKFDRRYFDPERYRIILFDQRGAGRSTPHAELENNTSQNLVEDMEKIRNHLQVERWVLFGGSWGSSLSLLYAEAWPEKVLGMVLRGIFLCRDEDINWFYQSGADRVFPDYWKDFIAPIADGERDNLLSAYYKKLTGSNELAKMAAAKAWATWEGRCSTLRPSTDTVERFAEPHRAMAISRIEAHYFMHKSFLEPDQLLRDAHKLKDIPGIIVHGRYDMVCPLDGACALHEAWPASNLQIIRDAGHSAQEPGIVDALVHATNDMAQELSGRGDQRG